MGTFAFCSSKIPISRHTMAHCTAAMRHKGVPESFMLMVDLFLNLWWIMLLICWVRVACGI
jgi:hypothetical protein